MINYLKCSFKIELTCTMNMLIYGLKKIPLIKKIIPFSLYGNDSLKSVIIIFVALYKVVSGFISKAIYIGIMVYLPVSLLGGSHPDYFIRIILFLTIIGAITKSELVTASKNKYYAIILMNMEANKYAISMYLAYLIETLLFFTPSLIIFGLFANVPLHASILLSILVVLIKIIGDYINLYCFQINKANIFKSISIATPIYLGGLLLAYFPIELTFINMEVILIAFVICGGFAYLYFKKIIQYKNYSLLYKKIINLNTLIFNAQDAQKQMLEKQMQKNISLDDNKKFHHQKGYEYFNSIFISRHRKILMNSALKYAGIYFVSLVATTLALTFEFFPTKEVNGVLLKSLPISVFLMYFSNRGAIITQAMFFNCDHSLLTYKFYRSPKVILKLFKIRLKTLTFINFIPSIVLALGLPLLLYVSGGSTIYNYLSFFVTFIFLSLFFSVHYLVIYYLLQPYDINMQQKSIAFNIVSGLTYGVCYLCAQIETTAILFALGVIIFTVLYVIIALILVYCFAPKKFKLK